MKIIPPEPEYRGLTVHYRYGESRTPMLPAGPNPACKFLLRDGPHLFEVVPVLQVDVSV